ncbi:hypothetical protein Syun_025941 [Stephania yunnanensis]|uniref:Uncharacterized protein n=1 Tax=Stephania yunnanensis TaxID=152371 RepID=A0AAP0HW83_9MAGN
MELARNQGHAQTEEGRLRKPSGHSAHLTMHDGASKKKAIPGRKDRRRTKPQ